MNLKDLSKKEERLAPGHRMCPGCAAPIVARMITKATDHPIVVANATGCLEVSTTIFPYTAWKVPWIHNAFENAAATLSGVETAYKVLKKKGKIKKDIKFVAFGGDGGTYDIGLQSLSGTLERGHDLVYVCYDNEAYMNCLSLDTFVMIADGLKRITEISKGDMVYAFDQKTCGLVLKKCTGVFDNGIKDVYELNTLHHTIKATSNHPFLVVQRTGKKDGNSLVWKTIAELKSKDEIIVSKKLYDGKPFRFPQVRLSQKGDYKVNKINEINLPKTSSPGFMELLGLYVGDGWIRVHKGEVGFSLPEKSNARKRFMELYRILFSKDYLGTTKNEVYVYSVNLARLIDSLGFGKGAKNKLIPPWIFTLPQGEKESFLKGLMLSDGYAFGKSCRYVSASIDLLKTLRLLLQTMDYRVGKIHQQTKKKGTFVVYRQLLEDSTYGYICFSKKRRPDTQKYLSQVKQRDFLADNEHFGSEKIMSIRLVGKEPTLDLRVDGEHNFLADGIVVHNTGVQRSSATPFGADTKTSPAGKAHQGKEEFKKDLMAVVAAHKIPYAAQASIHNWNDLMKKAEKAFEIKGPSFLLILSPCVPGWGIRMDQAVDISKLACDTCFWPLYEIEDGEKYTLNYEPKVKLPVVDWLKPQARFKHLFRPENAALLEKIQKQVDKDWEILKKKASE